MKLLANELSMGLKFLLLGLLFLVTTPMLQAETFMQSRPVWPAFEGWRPNTDGTFSLMFGYMNENWEQQPFVEIGDNNFF